MASEINKILISVYALKELSSSALFHYFQYRLSLHFPTSLLSPKLENFDNFPYIIKENLFPLPQKNKLLQLLSQQDVDALFSQAEEILNGRFRLFDLPPAPLLGINGSRHHWSYYAKKGVTSLMEQVPFNDIKLLWEEGRLGWVFPICRAYIISNDEKYSDFFWQQSLSFLSQNHAYQGIHWLSAQEVATRLMALLFAYQVFAKDAHSSEQRKKQLAWHIIAHAKRIPLTLCYAKAQNNNHLISEAVGLYSAALALPTYPESQKWKKTGWKLAHQAFQQQISDTGCYIQHSTNYHRMMLQLGIWFMLIWKHQDSVLVFPQKTLDKLAAATNWLYTLADKQSGQTPNLGHNDGSYIFPLTSCAYRDYRPVVQNAAKTFLSKAVFSNGLWDEMSLWFNLNQEKEASAPLNSKPYPPSKEPHCLHNNANNTWAYMRTASFHNRPAHADQLHVDLWWHGKNILQDAGTYLYNASPPWQNALTTTFVHNTITIDDTEQMQRISRFLYLNPAQATLLFYQSEAGVQRLSAEHNGYRKRGIIHRRSLSTFPQGNWEVLDELLPNGKNQLSQHKHKVRLHWLVLDGAWQIEESHYSCTLSISYDIGQVNLRCETPAMLQPSRLQLVRAGKLLYGNSEISPTLGWVSPHYAKKETALSFSLLWVTNVPFTIKTEISFIK